MVDFLVVMAPSSYNAIVRHPTLNSLRAVTSTYHLKMKFPTNLGLGEVRGEHVLALECYAYELRHEVKVVASAGGVGEDTKPPLPPTWPNGIRKFATKGPCGRLSPTNHWNLSRSIARDWSELSKSGPS